MRNNNNQIKQRLVNLNIVVLLDLNISKLVVLCSFNINGLIKRYCFYSFYIYIWLNKK
jgi:hypothetical protein